MLKSTHMSTLYVKHIKLSYINIKYIEYTGRSPIFAFMIKLLTY